MRAGATVAGLETLSSLAPAVAVLVPSEYAINADLFTALDGLRGACAWLESTPGCAVLAGPADQLGRFAASPA